MTYETKVVPRRGRPTQKSYRSAVADVIRCLKSEHRLTNRDLADRIGCSDETISNAENERTDLKAVILLAIQHEFGPEVLDPVAALSGSRCVEIESVCDVDTRSGRRAMSAAARLLTKLSEALEDNEITDAELLAMEPELRELEQHVAAKLVRVRRLKLRVAA